MIKKCLFFLLCICTFSSTIAAIQAEDPERYETWIFSGMIHGERGDTYGYFFKLQRDGNKLSTDAALIDSKTHALVFREQNKAIFQNEPENVFHVGSSFLQFNPINARWVFGVKTKDKKGFNFQVDTFMLADNKTSKEDLYTGVWAMTNRTNALTGHLWLGDEREQFVVAKHGWYRHLSSLQTKETLSGLQGVMCYFEDDSGLHALTLPKYKALKGAIAGQVDALGTAIPMSQFVEVHRLPQGAVNIVVPSPALRLTLSEYLTTEGLLAGFVSHGKQLGFCLLDQFVIPA